MLRVNRYHSKNLDIRIKFWGKAMKSQKIISLNPNKNYEIIGEISVNAASYGLAQDPFGGRTNSGLGREHGKQGMRELCSIKVIALKK